MTKPWDRRSKETPQAWAAFVAYRDLGPERSLSKAAEASGRGAGNTRLFEEWSGRHAWVARCAAWDEHLDKLAQARVEKERGEMAARHAQLGQNLQALASAAVRSYFKEVADKAAPGGKRLVLDSGKAVRASEAAALAKAGSDLERLAKGEATERVETLEVRIVPTPKAPREADS